jgi:hypothetical protein
MSQDGLGLFAVFYGLDWVATVPPTVRLTIEAFGRENTSVVYGWIAARWPPARSSHRPSLENGSQFDLTISPGR